MAIPHSPISISTSSRAIDKCLEEAQFTGELILTGRKLKEFPKNSTKYDLSCTLTVDLSRNKLGEFPQQLEHLSSVEMLKLSHNVLKSIPPTITRLSNLVCLNLNCNFLSTLPSSLGGLVNLEILLLSNNKLVSIPEEICLLRNLMQLDVSCNQLAHLPPHLGSITSLKSLNLRQNLLVELPTSISLLNLKLLDFSSNRISRIPVEFGRMDSLEVLLLGKNPLVSPHANVCSRGLVHVLKMLNNEAAKDEKRRSHLSLHGNSPRFGNRKFAGSTSCLSFGSSVSPSLSSSSSFSSKHAPHVPLVINSNNINSNNISVNNNSINNPASLPPQPSKGSRFMSRSFKGTSGDEVPMHHINGALFKHQRSSSYASGMFHELPPPFANGFSHYDSSTLGRRKLDFDSFSSVRDDGADHSVVVEGCRDEVDETRKMATKLMDGTRRRRLSQGVDREELPQTAYRTNASHDNNNCSSSMIGPHQNGRCSTSSSSSSSSGVPQTHHPHNSSSSSNTLPSVHPKNILPLACRKALESMTQQLNDLEPGFTFRRTCRAAREEGDLIKRMQQVMESTLKVKLPSDPRASLRDGVLLCCLVNQLFPDTIPVIHTPPHPKADLSVAKCRLNVDNFLVSCHTVGLSKSQICSAPSILDERSLPDVARTVLSLVNLARGQTSV